MTSDLPSIGIVGPGRIGSSLAAALQQAGAPSIAVTGRSASAAGDLARSLGGAVVAYPDPGSVLTDARVVFLTVQDANIQALADELPWEARHIAVHCSGALGLDALAAASAAGAAPGCLHPLQSFPGPGPAPGRFAGITCGIEGDERSAPLLEAITGRLGARVVRLDGVDRALYHAAAVFAGNDIVAVMSAAARAWSLAGLPADAAREALAPLLLGAAASIAVLELPDALTGPVARGDVFTVERHLAALAAEPRLRDLYRDLALELLAIAPVRSPESRAGLERLLDR